MIGRPSPFGFLRDFVTRWDAVALLVVLALMAFFAEAGRGLLQPLAALQATPLSLDPLHLPEYAARTTLRMFVALALSLAFTLTYATWAAKSERAGKLLVPMLDILQSVPILGFISVTAVFFMSLAPGRVLGAEFVAVFAIFTSQAWNMAFSFYQSLRTVPTELKEVADSFRLSPWMRFWRLEVPFAMPALIWNMMMSMSGGWFFVVAAEAISVGQTTVKLPGVGSYIALAIEQRNLTAIGWAIATMLIVILLYDQLFFRPLVAWIDHFRVEQEPSARVPQSWVLTMLARSQWIRAVTDVLRTVVHWTTRKATRAPVPELSLQPRTRSLLDILWAGTIGIAVVLATWQIGRGLTAHLHASDALEVLGLGAITMLRVFVLITVASVVWVPIGVWVGLRPRAAQIVQPIAQFLAAFPANLLFPVVVFGIVSGKLNPNVWLSPLMILGTQWYILFNVIAGAAALPSELRYVARNLHVGGWLWWRSVALPGVFPYYVTGAITASGGSWNAAIVAELASWGNTKVEAHGLGAYIASATAVGDIDHVVLGVVAMSLFVLTINRVFWRPLYYYAERKFRLS